MIFNGDLVKDIARQKVALFLGSGVSSSAVTAAGGRIKSWDDFLKYLCGKVNEPLKTQVLGLIEKKDYLLSCEILQGELSDAWDDLINAEFGQIAEPSELHRAIIDLDQRIIVTTNFDKLVEACWFSKIGKDLHYPKIITKIDSNVFNIFRDTEGRYLIKLHGSVDDTNSLIFSKSEYITRAFGNSNYSTFFENLLLNFTVLFVGFSMDDPAIASLMEMYAFKYSKSRPHYMLSGSITEDNIIEINKRLRKLQIIRYDASGDHAQLPRIIGELASEGRKTRKELAAAAISALA